MTIWPEKSYADTALISMDMYNDASRLIDSNFDGEWSYLRHELFPLLRANSWNRCAREKAKHRPRSMVGVILLALAIQPVKDLFAERHVHTNNLVIGMTT